MYLIGIQESLIFKVLIKEVPYATYSSKNEEKRQIFQNVSEEKFNLILSP